MAIDQDYRQRYCCARLTIAHRCPEQELLDKCHPLGMFDSIATLAVASNMRELYRLVLVDTPLAPYFSESLSAGARAPVLPVHLPCTTPCRTLSRLPHTAVLPCIKADAAAVHDFDCAARRTFVLTVPVAHVCCSWAHDLTGLLAV